MAKLKQPFLSLAALGSFAKTLTLRRRGRDTLIGETPHPTDPQTFAQKQWRHMYQKAVALWHLLSPAEKAAWERQATPRHMIGFAYFISQALKPNPGLYLPLQGGVMQGDIDMATNRITDLPAPGAANDPARLADLAALVLTSKSRAYRTGDWWVSTTAWIRVPLNAATYDNDSELDITSKLGTADATELNKLHDDDGGFTAADVGKWLYNNTDYTYTQITGFVDSGELDLADDIMANGEGYELYAGTFTVTTAGYYLVAAVIRCNWTLADKWYFAGAAKNGTPFATGGWQSSVGDGIATNCISGVLSDIVYCNANDVLELQIYHNEGNPGKFRGEASQTYLAVHKLS